MCRPTFVFTRHAIGSRGGGAHRKSNRVVLLNKTLEMISWSIDKCEEFFLSIEEKKRRNVITMQCYSNTREFFFLHFFRLSIRDILIKKGNPHAMIIDPSRSTNLGLMEMRCHLQNSRSTVKFVICT